MAENKHGRLTMSFCATMDRPVRDEHYIVPGGYEVEINGENIEFDFSDSSYSISGGDGRKIEFFMENLDLAFSPESETLFEKENAETISKIVDWFVYTGETDDPKICVSSIDEITFRCDDWDCSVCVSQAVLDAYNGTVNEQDKGTNACESNCFIESCPSTICSVGRCPIGKGGHAMTEEESFKIAREIRNTLKSFNDEHDSILLDLYDFELDKKNFEVYAFVSKAQDEKKPTRKWYAIYAGVGYADGDSIFADYKHSTEHLKIYELADALFTLSHMYKNKYFQKELLDMIEEKERSERENWDW